jgi:hypothetical protein
MVVLLMRNDWLRVTIGESSSNTQPFVATRQRDRLVATAEHDGQKSYEITAAARGARRLVGGVRRVPLVDFELPDDLHRRAQSKAALPGQRFYAYLIDAIRRQVEADEAEDRETGRGQ